MEKALKADGWTVLNHESESDFLAFWNDTGSIVHCSRCPDRDEAVRRVVEGVMAERKRHRPYNERLDTSPVRPHLFDLTGAGVSQDFDIDEVSVKGRRLV